MPARDQVTVPARHPGTYEQSSLRDAWRGRRCGSAANSARSAAVAQPLPAELTFQDGDPMP
jgi:hypothetical protein